MAKKLILFIATFVSLTMASPTPVEYRKEIGCALFPAATTRTPFCTPQ